MADKGWQRARSGEQIEVRVNQILEAAAELFRHTAYEDVTMMKIADAAGFTRSNLYRYFRTREEIFLALYMADSRRWTGDVDRTFRRRMNRDEFITTWMTILGRHQRFVELTPLLNMSLERNASREVLKETKLTMAAFSSQLIPIIQRALPDLSRSGVLEFLQTNLFLIAGTWPAGHRTPMQNDVLDETGIPELKIDFFDFPAMGHHMLHQTGSEAAPPDTPVQGDVQRVGRISPHIIPGPGCVPVETDQSIVQIHVVNDISVGTIALVHQIQEFRIGPVAETFRPLAPYQGQQGPEIHSSRLGKDSHIHQQSFSGCSTTTSTDLSLSRSFFSAGAMAGILSPVSRD